MIDLTGNNRNGKIHHCDRENVYHEEDFKEVGITMVKRRTFYYYLGDNGFYENKWVYTETRKNQVRFYNKVLKGKTNWRRDGLDTLRYKLMSETEIENGILLSCQL